MALGVDGIPTATGGSSTGYGARRVRREGPRTRRFRTADLLRQKQYREWVAGYLLIAPDVFGLLLFVAVPLVLTFVLGLYNVSGFGSYSFAGLGNYRRMLDDPLFLESLRVTGLYVVLFVPCVFFVSLGLGVLVAPSGWISGLARTLFFLPNVVGLIVVGVVWEYLLNQRQGVIDTILAPIGAGNEAWLGNPRLVLGVLVFVSVWYVMGLYMIIFMAGVQDIPQDYIEAARLDGAGRIATFWHITWPLLKPTSLFVFLMASIIGIAGLQSFDLVYVMTKGGPANATQVLAYYIYQVAFQYGELGYASAMSSVYVLFLLLWSLLILKVTRGGRFAYAD